MKKKENYTEVVEGNINLDLNGIDEISEEIEDENTYRNRNWVFTINNYTEENYTEVLELDCKYLIVGKEIGKLKKTPHLQGYIEFKDAKSFKKMKKLLPRAWLGARKGTAEQASDYCRKDKNYFEKGTMSKQGERKDLMVIKEKILNGESVNSIALEEPILYHKYGRTMNKLEEIVFSKRKRTEMTEGKWIYGNSGTGKSKHAFKNFDYKTHYIYPCEKNGWCDNYTGQDIVIFDDYCIEDHTFRQLLKLVDIHPSVQWPRRNKSPIPFTSKQVIITCDRHPREIFGWTTNERDEFMRRFDILNLN